MRRSGAGAAVLPANFHLKQHRFVTKPTLSFLYKMTPVVAVLVPRLPCFATASVCEKAAMQASQQMAEGEMITDELLPLLLLVKTLHARQLVGQ